MEILVNKRSGIPETAIISIRAGGTRRQAPVTQLDRPLKFPSNPDENTSFKVDVLDQLGSARVAYNPSEHEYSLALESMDPNPSCLSTGMEVSFKVRRAGEELPDFKTGQLQDTQQDPEMETAKRTEASARDYLEKHGLTSFMQFLMQSLMKDKPADPYSFLQKQVTKRMVTEVSRSVAGDKVDLLLEDKGLETLLQKFTNAEAPMEVTTEQLEQLERDAAAAGEQLRADNARLRETAEQLKTRYGQLLQETAQLQEEERNREAPKATADMPPIPQGESPQLAAYREIAQMQDDISSLAKENADLVSELAKMRASIDQVHGEIEGIQAS